MKGIFVPDEFLEDERLNLTECMVLSIYRYYTVEGDQHCCMLKNKDVCKMVRISERNLQFIKKHLKDIGYIRTDGGIKVTFIKDRGEAGFAPKGEAGFAPGVKKEAKKGEASFTHKKEKKRKIKKEIKKEKMTNFDLLLERLPKDYKTEERMKYMIEHYKDRINSIDVSGGIFDFWLVNVKSELNKLFPMEYKVEKVEVKVDDTIDLF